MKYEDFIDLKHKPKDEIIALFRIEPAKGFNMEDASSRVASKSSCGTWSDLIHAPQKNRKIESKSF
jgi:ribulose-bisphosphate carboxylase large chain